MTRGSSPQTRLAALALIVASAAGCTLAPDELTGPCHPWEAEARCGDRSWQPVPLALPGRGFIELSAAVEPKSAQPRFALAGVRVSNSQTAHIVAESWHEGDASFVWSPSAGQLGFHEQPFARFTADGVLLLTHHTATQAEGGGEVFASFLSSEGRVVAASRLSEPPNAATTTTASAESGDATLVWAQTLDDGRIGVSVAERDAGDLRWSTSPTIVSIPVLFANDPRVVMNGRGDTLVSWYQSTGDTPLRVYASLRGANDVAFTTPEPGQTLSASYTGPEGLDGLFLQDARPALSEQGAAVVFWTQPDGGGRSALFFAESSVGATDWARPSSNGEAFTRFDGVASDPVVAFGAGGHLFVAWRRTLAESQRLELAIREPDGTWRVGGRDPLVLAEAPVLGPPAMAVVGDRAVLAWQVARRVVRTTFVEASAPRAHVVEDINQPTDVTVGDPVVAANATGHALLTWVDGDVVEAVTWTPGER